MAGIRSLGVDAPGPPAPAIAPLRAIDWRFLLPGPVDRRFDRLLLLGGAPGLAARAMSAGIATEVLTELHGPARADLVAACANAPNDIPDIARAVAPNGLLYLEVDRERRGGRATTPGRVAKTLRAAGLTACAFYALEPSAQEPHAFIPLDAPHAMSWHRRTSYSDRAAVRIANAVRRHAVRIGGPTVAALDRPYAVVAVGGDAGPPVPGVLREPEVVRRLAAAREPKAAVMLTYGSDRVLLFPFGEDSRDPLGVVKVPKDEAFVNRTENEQRRLTTLRGMLDDGLRRAIPEPLGAVRLGRTMASCERFMAGASLATRAMDSAISLDAKSEDVRLAAMWLARFHRATEVRRATIRDLRRSLVDDLLESYYRELGTPADNALRLRLAAVAESLGARQVAVAMQHRDFAAWNVLRSGNELAVVDWEGARDGFAALDAVHLVTTWLYSVRLGQGVDDEAWCVHDILDPTRDATASVAYAALVSYLHALGLDPRVAPLLVALHRIELALRRLDQLRLQREPTDDAPLLQEARIVRSLAADADRLFPLSTS
ncbi:MAG TPA: phosphotransferase [Gemmatimonadaceae bacterium]|nr:phosphotransferase [Gemmatimonadaceae bacterium]